MESSSGGVFSLLAEEILQNSGVVFGAAMSEDCRKAQHIAVERQEDLWKLRGSKYLQSEIGSTYRQAENAEGGQDSENQDADRTEDQLQVDENGNVQTDGDRKSTRLNSSHPLSSRMPSSA